MYSVFNKTRIAYAIILGVALIGFSIKFWLDQNYEFLGYVVVVLVLTFLIGFLLRRIVMPDRVLGGILAWGLLHLAGGGIIVNGKVLYHLILIPITESIFRYDQFVHILGFGFATYFMYIVMRPFLSKAPMYPKAFFLTVLFAGLGIGALNEIVEFIATISFPQTNVGGYINTSLDLVADLIGAVIAAGLALRNERKSSHIPSDS